MLKFFKYLVQKPLLIFAAISLVFVAIIIKNYNVDPLNTKLTTKQNNTVTIKNFIGKKPLIIVFWASWCKYCEHEVGVLNSFWLKHHEVNIIGIQLDEGELNQTFKSAKYILLNGGSNGNQIMYKFGNTQGSIPFIVFLDTDGTVLGSNTGEISFYGLEQKTLNLGLK